MKIPFYRHNVGTEELRQIKEVIASPFLTTGPKTKAFESALAEYLHIGHAVGVTNWTMGGLITLAALGIGAGDEIITSPLTFISTANVALYLGAKPVFVDAEETTGNINADLIEAAITPRTKAIVPVHLYGQMCDMKKIHAIAKRHNLYVIEDCAHCIEGSRDGVEPGTLSDAAIFSFYATKNIASGEGGAIATQHAWLYEKLLVYRLHGMSKSAADRYTASYRHWDMELLGYKCNMSDIQAAMLIPQLRKIETFLTKKEKIAQKYEKAIKKLPQLSHPQKLPHSKHARHIFTIWVAPEKRDFALSFLEQKGIGVAVNFRAIHLLSYYRQTFGFAEGSFPVAERIGNSTITIPLYPKLKRDEVDYILTSLQELNAELSQ